MPCRVWPVIAFLALAVSPLAGASAQTDSTRRPDSLSSGGLLRGPALRRLAIDDPRLAFTLIPGVLARSGDVGISTAPDPSIRGGVPGHASVYIDGAPARFQTLGTAGLGIAANAIDEAWLTTGIAPAVLADAAGGVVSYVTRTGGDHVAGHVLWEGDGVFGNGVSVGYGRIDATVGGPLRIAPNLSFFLSFATQGQSSRYRSAAAASAPSYAPFGVDTVVDFASGPSTQSVTIPRFVQYSGSCSPASNAGIECQGLSRPMDWAMLSRSQAKLRHTYGVEGASAVSVTWVGGEFEQRSFPGQLIMNPSLYGAGRARSEIAVVNWRHQLRGPLAFEMNLSYGRDDQINGPLTAASEAGTRQPCIKLDNVPPCATLQFRGPDVVPLPVGDRLVRNIRTNSGLRVPYLNRADLANRQPYRLNPFGALTAWPSEGVNAVVTLVSERRVQGRWGLEWRPTLRQRVTFGIDGESTTLSFYQAAMTTEFNLDAFANRPTRVGVFAGDRLELGSKAVLDVGVRYDRITPGGEFPTTPGRIYTNPAWFPASDTSDALYASSVARVFTKTTTHTALSPRIRFGYAFSPATSIHVGFGRYVEPPSWAAYFQRSNADLDFTNTSSLFGRDVKFATASLFDVGVRSSVSRAVDIDVAAYYKDLPQYVGRFQPFADPVVVGDTFNINVLTVVDAHGVGLDARLAWRAGEWLTASGAYSLLHATVGGDGVTTHAVAAVADARARGFSAQIMMRATSGLAYDRATNFGLGTITPSAPLTITTGSARLPWTKRIDVRIAREVRVWRRAWTLYTDARNLFSFQNTRAVFDETGDVVNPLHRSQALAPEYGNLTAEASGSGALEPDGTTINLSACSSWVTPVNCVMLTRVERRFGDGNGLYSLLEQQRAMNAYYDAFDGPWFLYGPGRTLRLGVEVEL